MNLLQTLVPSRDLGDKLRRQGVVAELREIEVWRTSHKLNFMLRDVFNGYETQITLMIDEQGSERMGNADVIWKALYHGMRDHLTPRNLQKIK